ncbi:MAG: tRNA (adenosine(37)-N6)-threonylcarbamoyltransferase complex ATPase subunit type 1 TsaE [Betaproteobacteria bacterium]|nr:tRNA (adenosine(37)-N6)-threonylcarbamoyltransferase complex ATPase subunit type 1 TsaE [Betaproteobacteria bacterium]
MPRKDIKNIELAAEADTFRLGARVAEVLCPGALIHLSGDLGAGKTTLVRGMLRALGYEGRVKSPTFSIVELYELSKLSLYHFDFYRFESSAELQDSGLLEHFGTDAVCIVEWPENAGPTLPRPDLLIRLELGSQGGRHAAVSAHSDRGLSWLARLDT